MIERVSLYRKVEVRMWSDENFCALSPLPPSGQSLWLFLLTGPFTGPIPGLFRAGRASMAEALNWELEDFDKAFTELFEKGMALADWKARLVWLPKAIKSNPPASPNVIVSWSQEWDLLPECDLKNSAFQALKDSISSMTAAFTAAFDKSIRKPSWKASVKSFAKTIGNQEQEQEQKKENISTSAEIAAVAQRAKKAYTPDDEKCAQWIFDRIRANNPDHKQPNMATWADDVRLMRERDRRQHREICELFGWAQDDDFWRSNILSPAKLREKWDQLTIKRGTPQKGHKHDNFAAQDYSAGVKPDGTF